MTTATLCLPAPRFDWLLPAPAAVPIHTMPDFALILQLDRPIVTPQETMEAVADLHRDFLEMAYMRNQQTPGEYFPVSQWDYRHGQKNRRLHWHKGIANKLAMAGLFQPHPNNNGSRSRYRISSRGIACVEARRKQWLKESGWTVFDRDRFEAYADRLMAGRTIFGDWRDEAYDDRNGQPLTRDLRRRQFDDFEAGLPSTPQYNAEPQFILPEPGRSWHWEQAFEEARHSRRSRRLHRLYRRGIGGLAWGVYSGGYFYSPGGYNYAETEDYKNFAQPARLDIPF